MVQTRLQQYSHLGIRPSGNPPPQKVLPLYEGVGSIPGILKNIRVCEFRLGFLSYIQKKKKRLQQYGIMGKNKKKKHNKASQIHVPHQIYF